MEFNKKVSNPMLVGLLELIKEEDTPEHRNMLVGELQKAELLAPAIIDPAPEEDGEGGMKLAAASNIRFPMLHGPADSLMFMGFTDMKEYEKWEKDNRTFPFFALKFDDYVALLMQKDAGGNPCPAKGIVINPNGANLLVPKDIIAGIMGARMAQALRQTDRKAGQGMRIPFPAQAVPGLQKDPADDPKEN